jgi:hypothetical protein
MGERILLLCVLLAGALPAQAQQQSRGQLPADSFVIDPNKLATWNSKTFATADKEFAIKQFESSDLSRWTHEFPGRRSALGEKSVDLESVDLPEWKGDKVLKTDLAKHVESQEADLRAKSEKLSGPLVTNEKWSHCARKEETEEQAEVPISGFIVQATIRPLGVPEVQEKLNEYSSPPGERQKQIPSQLQKSSKF